MDSPFQFYLRMLNQRPESCCGTGPTSGKSWLRRFPENSHLKRHWVCSQLSVGAKLLQQFSWSSPIIFFYSCNYSLVATAERFILGTSWNNLRHMRYLPRYRPTRTAIIWSLPLPLQPVTRTGCCLRVTAIRSQGHEGVHHSNWNIHFWNDKSAICKVIRIFSNMFHPSTNSGFY